MRPCDIKQLQSVLLPWRILQITLPIGHSKIDQSAKDLDSGHWIWPFTCLSSKFMSGCGGLGMRLVTHYFSIKRYGEIRGGGGGGGGRRAYLQPFLEFFFASLQACRASLTRSISVRLLLGDAVAQLLCPCPDYTENFTE